MIYDKSSDQEIDILLLDAKNILAKYLEPIICKSATSIAQAKKILLKNPVDVIIVEYSLLEKDMDNLAKQIHTANINNIPVLVALSNNDHDLGMQLIKHGFHDYLFVDNINSGNLLKILVNIEIARRHQVVAENDNVHYYDMLTVLPNRLLLHELVRQAIKQSERHKTKIAVIVLSLQDFKLVNEVYGYSIGDQILKAISIILHNSIRDSDILAKISGDEFVIVLTEVLERRLIVKVLTKILESVSKPIELDNQKHNINVNLGVSVFPDDSQDLDGLLKCSTSAISFAKNMTSKISFYSPAMKKKTKENMIILGDIREAVLKEEFVLYWQPQVDAKANKIIGAESLLRWQHPSLGLLGPNKFIDLAEKSGFMQVIGRWVFNKACEWRAECIKDYKDFKISINVSPSQLTDHFFLFQIEKTLSDLHLEPKNVCIEITENIFIQDVNKIISVLNTIKSSGLLIAMDDFGTGYSSLSCLERLPIDILKLDRSFIAKLSNNQKLQRLVQSLISMANTLGLSVIAEGVEDQEQLDFLVEHGCNLIQGYLFSKPLSEQMLVEKLISNNKSKLVG